MLMSANAYRVICVFALCLWAATAQGELKKMLHFEPIPLDYRMQDWRFYSAAQDPEGFMWFATTGGLVRFDGYRFTAFKDGPAEPNSPLSNATFAVYMDNQGTLWVGSWNKLSRFDRGTETFHPYPFDLSEPDGMQSNMVDRIVEDAAGNLWLSRFSSGGDQIALKRFDKDTGVYSNFRHDPADPESLPAGFVNALLVDREDVLWVGTYAHQGGADLARFDRKRGVFHRFFNCDSSDPDCPQPVTPSDRPAETWVGGLFEDDKGRIWINGAGLMRYDRESNTYSRFPVASVAPRLNPGRFAGSIVQDRSGMLWYDERSRGLSRLDPDAASTGPGLPIGADEVVVPEMVLENELILYQDRGGVIWICDFTERLRRFDPATLAFGHVALLTLEGVAEVDFSSVKAVEGPAGALWLGDVNFGLHRLDRETGVLESFAADPANPLSLHNSNIRNLYVSSTGTLWIATNLGISHYDAAARRFHYIPIDPQPVGPADVQIYSIAEDDQGLLWLGSDLAIYRLNPSTNDILAYRAEAGNSKGIQGEWFSTHRIANDPGIWIGSPGRLSRLDPESGSFTHYPHVDHKPDSVGLGLVSSIQRDAAGVYWVAGMGGLYRLEPATGVFSRAGRDGSPAPQSPTRLLNDRLGNLWVATDGEGLWRYMPTTGAWDRYDVRDGLAHNVTLSLARTARGELLVGSRNGLNVFDPARLPGPREPPRVRFTNFLLGNAAVPINREGQESPLHRSVSLQPDIALGHSDYLFAFEFAVPGYRFPEAVRYAYRLVGFDDRWIETGPDARHATYTNVPPGDYTLRVRAAGRDGAWSPHEAALHLSILPPWWRTWWAYTAYLLAFLLALATYVRLRTLALTRRTEVLEQTVAERTARILEHERQIEAQAVELQQALDLKEKLITNISHEFRTPLTLILGPVRRLLERSPRPEEAMQLQTIKRSGLRLLRLVDQLLGLARLGNLENHAPRQTQPVVPIVRTITDSFRPLAMQKGLKLELDIDGEPWVHAEPDALEIVLLNLLSNAVKYTPKGGTVRVEVGMGAGNEIELTVADTGIGIPVEDQDAVFERFRRAGDNKEHIPGAGIGLALVSDVVAAHGGRVTLTSQPSVGTQVRVRLPACPAPTARAEAENPPVLSSAVEHELELLDYASSPARADGGTDAEQDDESRPTVLIVEDNEELQQYLTELLGADYRCDLAGDGERALERAREHIPDLVLLDVMLPKLDGFQVSHALKEDERTSHIPIIMLTARQDRESRLDGWHERVDAYFTKPFDDDELKLRIANLLEIRDILRQRFRNHFFEDAAPAQVLNDKERRFVERLEQALEKGHSDPDFGVNQLASEVFMSTRQLQRKLKSVVGHSPTEFLRSFRLRRSRELLRSGTQVGLVADEVGFSSPAYFTSCFKAQFGQTPSEYQQRLYARADST